MPNYLYINNHKKSRNINSNSNNNYNINSTKNIFKSSKFGQIAWFFKSVSHATRLFSSIKFKTKFGWNDQAAHLQQQQKRLAPWSNG